MIAWLMKSCTSAGGTFSCQSSKVCEVSGITGQFDRNVSRPFEDVDPETRRDSPTFEDALDDPAAAIAHLPRCSFEEPDASSDNEAASSAPTDDVPVTEIVGVSSTRSMTFSPMPMDCRSCALVRCVETGTYIVFSSGRSKSLMRLSD